MQLQDVLTALFFAIPSVFAVLMLVDFITGLRTLLLTSPISRQMSITQDPLLLPEQTPHIEDSVKTNSPAKVIEILPDPWTLPTQKAADTTRVQQTPYPRLLLLPPATAPLPTVQPAKKRRGRPRKAA